MSKRYPPIFNVILFAVAVIFMLLNPIVNMMAQLLEIVSTNLLKNSCGDTFDVPSTITMWIFGTLSAGAIAVMIHVWVKLHNIKKQKQKETA